MATIQPAFTLTEQGFVSVREVMEHVRCNAAGDQGSLCGTVGLYITVLDKIDEKARCGLQIATDIVAERYSLNVYRKHGHFRKHKDTPRGADMLDTLVIRRNYSRARRETERRIDKINTHTH